MRHHWRLFVTITPLLRSKEGTCYGQVCIVVLVDCQCLLHLSYVLAMCMCALWYLKRTWCCQCLLHWASVLAICGAWGAPGAVSACCTCRMCWLYVCMCCGAWSSPGDVSACCTGHLCWLYVVLGVYLVLSVLAALVVCVGYM